MSDEKNDQEEANNIVTLRPFPRQRARAVLSGELLVNVKRTMSRTIRSATAEQAADMLEVFQEKGWID